MSEAEIDHILGVGNKLPMVFLRGEPTDLRDMTTAELGKFIPFLVHCVTDEILPETEDPDALEPSWWPEDVPFCKKSLQGKLPQKELLQLLVKIVTRCYSYYNSSYIITFSASLVNKDLKYVRTRQGTTKVLGPKGQLIVLVRTSTLKYDNRAGVQIQRGDFYDGKRVVATDLTSSFSLSPKLVRIEDDPKLSKFIRNGKLILGKTKAKGDDNRSNSGSSTTAKNMPRTRKRRVPTFEAAEAVETPCRHCNQMFPKTFLAQEHEDVCKRIIPEGKSDLRELPDRQEFFASVLGLRPVFRKPDPVEVNNNLPDKMGGQQDNHTGSEMDELMETDESDDEARVKEQKQSKKKKAAAPVQTSKRTMRARAPVSQPKRELRRVITRSKMTTFIRQNPVLPLSSIRGQQMLDQFGERIKWPRKGKVPDYERDCLSLKCNIPKKVKAKTKKKNLIKEDQYVHTISFNAAERKIRNQELVVGVSQSSFPALNKCAKTLKVNITRLSEKVVQSVLAREAKRQLGRNGINISQWIKKCQPIVSLRDFRKFPDAIPAAFRNKIKINLSKPNVSKSDAPPVSERKILKIKLPKLDPSSKVKERKLDDTVAPPKAKVRKRDDTVAPPQAKVRKLDDTVAPPKAKVRKLDDSVDPPLAQRKIITRRCKQKH